MNGDETLIRKRLVEAAMQSYTREIPVVTDFLDLYQQTIFHSMLHELPPVCYHMMGGYDLAERKCILFTPYQEFPLFVPYKILWIRPLNPKFMEKLSHRDYLGAVMNLGISREKMGDLILDEENAYLFCSEHVAMYLQSNLSKVKHTAVTVEEITMEAFHFTPKTAAVSGSVASLRLDAVIALGFQESRNHMISYIEEGKTAVNGRIITSNGYTLKENDLISVRGLGKIRFIEAVKETRKGRLIVKLDKYI